MRWIGILLIVGISAGYARAQVFSSEFFSDPVSEGWNLIQQFCEPQVWVEGGEYHQILDFVACGPPPPPGGGQDSYVRGIQMNGVARWFCELRVATDGDRSEIPGNAPTVLAAGNFFGESYKVNVARDQVKFLSDNPLTVVFFDVEPGVPHTVRLELYNVGTATYRWFIDRVLVFEGETQDVFPSDDAIITWRGKAWMLPCENAWDYIRYGVPGVAHSGDYDSSGTVTLFDFFYFAECVADRGNGPDVPVDAGCEFADMDADGDVDFHDFALFQRALSVE